MVFVFFRQEILKVLHVKKLHSKILLLKLQVTYHNALKLEKLLNFLASGQDLFTNQKDTGSHTVDITTFFT